MTQCSEWPGCACGRGGPDRCMSEKQRREALMRRRLREGVDNLLNGREEEHWSKDVERQLAAEQETDFWHTFMMGKD